MIDPVTISKVFSTWQFDMGCRGVYGAGKLSFSCAPTAVFHYMRARKGKHHVLVVFDQWEQDVAESIVEMMMDCDSADAV